jgi:hypothetical protein
LGQNTTKNGRKCVKIKYIYSAELLSGAKVLQKLGVDVEIVALALKIAVWAEFNHFP